MDEADLDGIKLAALVGATPTAISYWRRGKRMPGALELQLLAKHLRCTMEELLGGREGIETYVRQRDAWREELAEQTGAAEKFIAGFPQRDLKRRLSIITERQGKLVKEQQAVELQLKELAAALEGKYPDHSEPNVQLNDK